MSENVRVLTDENWETELAGTFAGRVAVGKLDAGRGAVAEQLPATGADTR